MVSTVTNIPGHNQKVDSKVARLPSTDDANTQPSITGNEQVKETAAVTLAELTQQEPQDAEGAANTDVTTTDEKAPETPPQVPGPVLSAYNQGEQRIGTYVDKVV